MLERVTLNLSTATDNSFDFDTTGGEAFAEGTHTGTIGTPMLNPADPDNLQQLSLTFSTITDTFDTGEIFNYTLGLDWTGTGNLSGATVSFLFHDTANGWSKSTTVPFVEPLATDIYVVSGGNFEFTPEPSTWMLTAMGVATLVTFRRMRRPQRH